MRIPDSLLAEAVRDTWTSLRSSHAIPVAPPVFAVHGGRTRLGLWMRAQRTISVSREHILEDPWLDVQETILHELAHQIVDEVHKGEKDPHGPLFRATLDRLGGLVPQVTEEPPVLARVRKLLALAGSPNRHEAQLAMARAQKLMLKHRIDRARLDGGRGFVRRQLGTPRKRQSSWRGILLAVLARHFDVEAIQVRVFVPAEGDWASAWEILGRPEDVDMSDYAFAFVEGTAERLWAEHLRTTPRAGRSRDRFLYGVVLGFRDTLDATAEEARQEGLIPVADPALAHLFRSRHPRVQTRGSRVVGDAHFHAGKEAGGGVVLHRPITGKAGGGGLLEG